MVLQTTSHYEANFKETPLHATSYNGYKKQCKNGRIYHKEDPHICKGHFFPYSSLHLKKCTLHSLLVAVVLLALVLHIIVRTLWITTLRHHSELSNKSLSIKIHQHLKSLSLTTNTTLLLLLLVLGLLTTLLVCIDSLTVEVLHHLVVMVFWSLVYFTWKNNR